MIRNITHTIETIGALTLAAIIAGITAADIINTIGG